MRPSPGGPWAPGAPDGLRRPDRLAAFQFSGCSEWFWPCVPSGSQDCPGGRVDDAQVARPMVAGCLARIGYLGSRHESRRCCPARLPPPMPPRLQRRRSTAAAPLVPGLPIRSMHTHGGNRSREDGHAQAPAFRVKRQPATARAPGRVRGSVHPGVLEGTAITSLRHESCSGSPLEGESGVEEAEGPGPVQGRHPGHAVAAHGDRRGARRSTHLLVGQGQAAEPGRQYGGAGLGG